MQPLPEQTKEMPPEQTAGNDQEMFDKLAINALKIIHSEEVTDSTIKRIQGAKDKVDIIGEISLDIMNRLENSAGQNDLTLNANTVSNGLNVIVGEIINLAEAAGVQTLNEEQKYQAFSWAFSNYIDQAVKSGKISEEELIGSGQKLLEDGQGMQEQMPGQPEQMPEGQGVM